MVDEDIQSLEKEIGVPFPINFRTYLTACGIDSGGPGYAISRKWIKHNSVETIKTPCLLEPRKEVGFDLTDDEGGSYLSENEYPFKSDDVY